MYHWYFSSFVMGVYTTTLVLTAALLVIIVTLCRVRHGVDGRHVLCDPLLTRVKESCGWRL